MADLGRCRLADGDDASLPQVGGDLVFRCQRDVDAVNEGKYATIRLRVFPRVDSIYLSPNCVELPSGWRRGKHMGAAYYVVLNSDDPGFDPTVDGKALSRHSTQINAIATKLGLKALDDYCSLAPQDARTMMADIMGLEDEDDLPPDAPGTLASVTPEVWYDAGHGIDYARQLADHVRESPQSVKDADAVLYDLDSMLTVLTQAKDRELKWHLQVDF